MRQIELRLVLWLVQKHQLAPFQAQVFYSRRARFLDPEKMDLGDALAFETWVLP